ncbi:MAG: hypothetical protein HW377_2840, partial [Actinobacteria bacterium]|nr:hypothetical protein [Actinomycetota bacterium]
MPDRDDRIEHGPLAVRKLRGTADRLRIGDRVSPADEPHAVGLVGNFPGVRSVHGHLVKHPRHRLAGGAGSAGAEDRLPLANDLGLDEEVPECRMQRVGGRRCKDHFRVTRDFNRPACLGAVHDAYPAHLGVVLGRNGDFRVRVEFVVAAAKLHPRLRENRLVLLRLLERRLVGGGPELPACRIPDVAERAPVVTGAVFTPARHRDVLPAAVAAARVRDHHVVSAVRQQLHFRYGSVGGAERAHRHLGNTGGCAHAGELGGKRVRRRGLRNPFLIRLEPLLHRTVEEQGIQGEEAHALVMGHEGPDDRARLPATLPGRGVVDRLEKSVFPEELLVPEPLQIPARLLGGHHQRESGRIRRYDQVRPQPALEPEAGHSERAVLVVETDVDHVVAGFRHPPRHVALLPVLDLPHHRRLAGPVEQRVLVRRHHQERHEVLEHRPAPRKEDRFPPGCGEKAPKGEPGLLRQLSLRDRHERAKPRFRSQQIVVSRVSPPLADVVTDRQEMTPLVVEEAVLHTGKFSALQRKAVDRRDPFPCLPVRLREEPPELKGPLALLLDPCEFAQGRDPVETGEVAKTQRFIEGGPALTL